MSSETSHARATPRRPPGIPVPLDQTLAALDQRPRPLAFREPAWPLGTPRAWARDLAAVGAVTCFAVPLIAAPLGTRATFALVAAVAGAATGALLGLLVPRMLSPFVRRIPVLLLLGAGCGLGSLWGGLVGYLAGLASGADPLLSAHTAALCGFVQLGWFWLPSGVAHARRRPVWPAVLLAFILSPLMGLWLVACYHAI